MYIVYIAVVVVDKVVECGHAISVLVCLTVSVICEGHQTPFYSCSSSCNLITAESVIRIRTQQLWALLSADIVLLSIVISFTLALTMSAVTSMYININNINNIINIIHLYPHVYQLCHHKPALLQQKPSGCITGREGGSVWGFQLPRQQSPEVFMLQPADQASTVRSRGNASHAQAACPSFQMLQ